MRLFRFLRGESQISLPWLTFLLALSGLTNALILVVINQAIENTAAGSHTTRLLVLFAIVFTLFVFTRRRVQVILAEEIERILNRIRVRIADLVRKSDLAKLEKIDRSEIYSAMQRETAVISSHRLRLVQALQASALLVFANIYLAWLSLPAFGVLNGVILIGIVLYLERKKQLLELLKEPLEKTNKLHKTMVYVLDGFKEVKINAARNDDIFLRIKQRSDLARASIVESKYEGSTLAMYFHAIFLTALAGMVFLLPGIAPGYDDDVLKVVAIFFFIMGPMYQVAYTFPDLLEVETAAVEIQRIQERLEEAIEVRAVGVPKIKSFRQLHLRDLVVRFTDPRVEHPFVVGPINLTVEAGETLFLAGGNGSG